MLKSVILISFTKRDGIVAKQKLDVERLWFIADELIDGPRNNTFPVLMEALLSLRENRQYLDDQLVQEPFNANRSQRVKQKLDEDLEVTLEEDES